VSERKTSSRSAVRMERPSTSIDLEGLAVRSADLDDVFLSLTGRRDDPEVPAA
jgi:hypothetical protein